MSDILQTLLESCPDNLHDGVQEIFSTLFESETANSHDAVTMLANKVGENINKTDKGSKIVGLAAEAGLGNEPLPNDMDQLITSINSDIAKTTPLPELPTENDLPDLPDNGGIIEEPNDDDFDMSFDESQTDISDNPPPEDLDLPLDPPGDVEPQDIE